MGMKLLMQKLGYQIPAWQIKKRAEINLIEDNTKIQVRGVDPERQPFHLFEKISVSGFPQTAPKVFPSEVQKKQPYKYTLPSEVDQFSVEFESMGHYNEKNIRVKVNMAELLQHQSLVYEMVMDSQNGNWELVTVQDPDRNIVGVADFTQ